MPEKPEIVAEYGKMNKEDREKLIGTDEFQQVKNYYDEYHWTIQHNISVHVHRMKMGQESIGKVQYIGNTFVLPVHYPVPKDQQWEEGPDGIFHPPSCAYRESRYDKEMLRECRCGKKKRKYIFEKMKQVEKEVRDKKFESTGEHDEVPF